MEQPSDIEAKTVEQHPTQLMAEFAQEIYDDSRRTLSGFRPFYDKLTEHYEPVMRVNPLKGRYLRERAIWSASLTPIVHKAELALARAALPLIKSGKSLFENMPPGGTTYDGYRVYQRALPKPYKGARGDFMYAGAAWTVNWGQTISFRDEAFFLWVNYQSVHGSFCDYERAYRGYRRNRDPIRHFKSLLADSNETPVELLQYFKEHFMPEASPAECREAFLEHIDEFSWLSSSRRNFINDRFMQRYETPSCPFRNPEELATQGVWRVASLRNGPWKVPGFCPANVPLRSPEPDAADIVAELRELCGDTTNDPRASTAWMHLVFGAYLAEETLWNPQSFSLR